MKVRRKHFVLSLPSRRSLELPKAAPRTEQGLFGGKPSDWTFWGGGERRRVQYSVACLGRNAFRHSRKSRSLNAEKRLWVWYGWGQPKKNHILQFWGRFFFLYIQISSRHSHLIRIRVSRWLVCDEGGAKFIRFGINLVVSSRRGKEEGFRGITIGRRSVLATSHFAKVTHFVTD